MGIRTDNVRLYGGAAAAIAVAFACASACTAARRDDDAALGTSEATLLVSAFEPADKIYVAGAMDAGSSQHDLEGDYLPQVVCCENANAPPVTLQAQAIIARTYVYFHVAGGKGTQAVPFTGTSADGRYYCAQTVTPACMNAVTSTRGILTASPNASSALVANAGFYVDGPKPACLAAKSCTCPKPSTGTSMTPAAHEAGCDCFTWSSNGNANPAYVTYNWNNVGAGVLGSAIGNTGNESNRGCVGQNIQSCLGYAGWNVVDLVRFFYGQDQVLVHPDGSLVVGLDGGPLEDGGSGPIGSDGGPPGPNGTPVGAGDGANAGDGGPASEAEGGGCSAAGHGGHGAAHSATRAPGDSRVLLALVLALATFRRRRCTRRAIVR